jgi:hypothetical protein
MLIKSKRSMVSSNQKTILFITIRQAINNFSGVQEPGEIDIVMLTEQERS